MAEFLDVLSVIEVGSRNRKPLTAHKVASLVDISLYKTRKMLGAMLRDGLVRSAVVQHRENVTKTVYYITKAGVVRLVYLKANSVQYLLFDPPFDSFERMSSPDSVAFERMHKTNE